MLRGFREKSPVVHPSAWIADNAYLMGEVEVREGAVIWPGAVLRADRAGILVGRNAVIGDRCVVHGSAQLGDGVVLGASVMVHGIEVGANTWIGSGATVLEGSRVGEGCIIEPGSVVLPRAVIPSHSHVQGVPGEIIGQVTDEDLARKASNLSLRDEDLVRRYSEAGY